MSDAAASSAGTGEALTEAERDRLHAWFTEHRPADGWNASAQAWMDLFATVERILADRRAAGTGEARATDAELRDLRAAFDRDKWAGEWNSVPTALDRILADRRAVEDNLRARVEKLIVDCEQAVARESVMGEQVVTVRWLQDHLRAVLAEPATGLSL